jgi:hypothetical protein
MREALSPLPGTALCAVVAAAPAVAANAPRSLSLKLNLIVSYFPALHAVFTRTLSPSHSSAIALAMWDALSFAAISSFLPGYLHFFVFLIHGSSLSFCYL